MAKKSKKNLQKELKRVNTTTIIFVVIFALIGVGAGFGVTYYLTRNDVFKLKGESEITLQIGDEYVEQGATAIAFGKDISSSIEISGEVDTTTEGRYVVKYKVKSFRYTNHILYRLIVVEAEGE